MKVKVKKIISIIPLCIMLLLVGIFIYFIANIKACPPGDYNEVLISELPSGSMSDVYTSYDDLIVKAPLVITGDVKGDFEKIAYGGMKFVITEVKVDKIIRNERDISDAKNDEQLSSIRVLQTVMNEDPIIKAGEKKLLFLRQYEGPIAENVYIICGLYQGQFDLNGDSILLVNPLDMEVARENIPKTLDEISKDVSNAKYEFQAWR